MIGNGFALPPSNFCAGLAVAIFLEGWVSSYAML